MKDSLFVKFRRAFGTDRAFAHALGMTPGAIAQWRIRGLVPIDRCFEVEAATRKLADERGDPSLIVTCEQMRPEFNWDVVRNNPHPAPAPAAQAQ